MKQRYFKALYLILLADISRRFSRYETPGQIRVAYSGSQGAGNKYLLFSVRTVEEVLNRLVSKIFHQVNFSVDTKNE